MVRHTLKILQLMLQDCKISKGCLNINFGIFKPYQRVGTIPYIAAMAIEKDNVESSTAKKLASI